MAPRILFLADPKEDYVADSLLHGLRSLLGASAVDYPKRSQLYESYPLGSRAALYGRGFSLYALLDDIQVDRERPLERVASGEFDLVVVASIWRDWHWWPKVLRAAPEGTPLAVVDGADVPWMYPYGPTWWKSPRCWFLPRAHRRSVYFKREWTRLTGWLRWYGIVPPPLCDRLPLEPIAISYPAEKLAAAPPPKAKDFVAHIVDSEVSARVSDGGTAYTFAREEDYIADLRASRFGVTTKRRGWDALRHYEIAANGAVPCFRSLERKPPRCAPHGLKPGLNCLSYSSAEDLLAQVDGLPERRYRDLLEGALRWARENTTRVRAERFLEAVGIRCGTAPARFSGRRA